MTGSAMVPSDMERHHGITPLYSPPNRPDIVGRMPYSVYSEEENQRVEILAEALFHLTTAYGISFAGIGNSIPEETRSPEGDTDHITYDTTTFVEGVNMRDRLREMPLEITMGTIDKILSYYEDAAKDPSDRLYLTDLNLKQFIYGKLKTLDGEPPSLPDAYFVDMDTFLSNRRRELAKDPSAFNDFRDGIRGLAGDIDELKSAFPQYSFATREDRLKAIGAALGVDVPQDAVDSPVA